MPEDAKTQDPFPTRVVLGEGWPWRGETELGLPMAWKLPRAFFRDDCPKYRLVLERVGGRDQVRDWAWRKEGWHECKKQARDLLEILAEHEEHDATSRGIMQAHDAVLRMEMEP